MRKLLLAGIHLVLSATLLVSISASASDWQLIGPEGGDVRSLAYDPSDSNHIVLGTSTGQLFVSHDGGASWAFFAHLGPADQYVLDHIIFDPQHTATIYVAAWSLYDNDAGDVFRTDDSGQTWQSLKAVHGKSIRAMAMAPSDQNMLVIGAMDGVFRSRDAGQTWEQISPVAKADMKGITGEPLYSLESIAIDPKNTDIIYAGTWHLPWRTSDGGKTWTPMQQGWLMDSDVFSIIIDPLSPTTVWASACSGIYKSTTSGSEFTRMRGIPHSAIRTRVLKQDPKRPLTVYAGTTGGLWKTVDGGNKWELYSAPDVIVNDILIDPNDPEHVLLATDRGGVLASKDGFDHYTTSNRGFAHRVVGAVIADHKDPNRLYVGVVNDKQLGGFFYTEDAGKSWKLSNRGLDERDVLSLQEADNGIIYAGTNHGIFSLSLLTGKWTPVVMVRGPVPEWREKEAAAEPAPEAKATTPAARRAAARRAALAKKAVKPKAAAEAVIPIDKAPRVRSIELGEKAWYAATDGGLFISVDQGKRWYGAPVEGVSDFMAVDGVGTGMLTLVNPKHALLSSDAGKTWSEVTLPPYVTRLYSFTATPDGSLWLGSREGALRSTDQGKSWNHLLGGMPPRDVFAVSFDPTGQRFLATALNTRAIFESKDDGKTWQRSPDANVSIRAAMNYQGHLLAASTYNGLLLEQGAEPAVASNGTDTKTTSARQ